MPFNISIQIKFLLMTIKDMIVHHEKFIMAQNNVTESEFMQRVIIILSNNGTLGGWN